MHLDFSNERILVVMAHPDDCELLCAGTLARAKDEGAEIGIVVMCRGDKGMSKSTFVETNKDIRLEEATRAAAIISARLFWFGASDGELAYDFESRRRLIDIYQEFRPTLAIAHAPQDYHPDHRAANALAEAAGWFCASAGHAGQFPALAAPPQLWFADTIDMHQFAPGFFIDISKYTDAKERMLRCHQSQLQRGADGDFSPLDELMKRQYETRGAQSNTAAAEAFCLHHAFKRVQAW
jgi:LmbE family N-acetylglucosaminyl deacetylase